MKKFKNWLIVSLVLALSVSFTGCASEPQVQETSMEVQAEAPAEETAPVEEAAEVSLETLVKAYFAEMPSHIYKIGQADFVEKVKAGEDMTILDIRSAADYEAGHIEGAINAPWGGTAISEVLAKLPQDKPLYVYCVSGQTAGQTVHILNVAGFDARSVNLGFKFGISKVEGVDAFVTTEPTVVTENITEIAPAVQEAADAYFGGMADVAGTPFASYKVSEDNLKAMMDAGDDFYLLSIRSAEDYAKGHIDGAENLPWGAGMEQGFDAIPKDKPVVVYCYTGQTAGQTVAALRLLGVDAVSLNGGMGMPSNAPLGWTNKGYETVTGSIDDKVMDYFANMPSHIYKIGQGDFIELVKAGEDMTTLDIRSAADYEAGHIKGAINAPWGGTAISEVLSKLPQDKPLYVYCVSGQTAGQTVHILNIAGFDARSVNLGFKFGISKVEGVEEFVTTEPTVVTEDITVIDPAVQAAADAYYAGLADVAGTPFASYKVSEDNLKAMIDAGDDFYLLSIRKAEDFAAGHIEGAQNLPWGKDMAAGFAALPTDKPVVVYCYTGQTAGQTVAALRLLGVDAVSLNGGMGMPSNAPLGWTNKGYVAVQ